MYGPISSWRTSVFVLTLVAVATNVRGQDGNGFAPSYPLTDQGPAIQPSDNPQQIAYCPNRRPAKIGLRTIALCRRPKTLRTRIWPNVSKTWRKRWRNTPKPPMRPSLNRRPSP